jgi:hypothetical protein
MENKPEPSKASASLRSRLESRLPNDSAKFRIILKHKKGSGDQVISRLGNREDVRYRYQLLDAIAMSANSTDIDALTSMDQVEMIWNDEPVHTMLDQSVPLIGAPMAWGQGITGKGIKVGILDTGIDSDHPDFAQRIAEVKDFTGERPNDNHGHGTHVAGILGGSGAASNGKYKGVAPECLLYIAKVLLGDGSGNTSDVIAGIDWMMQQGVQVINLSLGNEGASDGTDALSIMCDGAVDHGLVVCVAAGNSGPGDSTIGIPACAKNVITIGATSKSDQAASFSSRGPTSDNRVKPDICFPGVSIISCRASGTSMGSPVDSHYTSASGTSMATPHASGTCALLLQARPDLSPQQIKDLLMTTAKNLNLAPNTQGSGRSDVAAAFTKLPTPVSTKKLSFSSAAQNAIDTGYRYAPSKQRPRGLEFIVAGLIEVDGSVNAFLNVVGINKQQAIGSLTEKFSFASVSPISPSTGTSVIVGFDSITDVASEIANQQGSPEIEPRHLLEAILTATDSGAYAWLRDTFEPAIPLEWVKQTLDGWPRDQEVTAAEIQTRIETERPADVASAFSDKAAVEDKLGFETQARALAEIILKPETEPPVVIGVYGPWGSGKSTFLKLVGKALHELHEQMKTTKSNQAKSMPDLLPIEYNAWEYIDATKLWAGLAQVVSQHLDERLSSRQRWWYAITRHARRFTAAFLIGLIPVAGAVAFSIWESIRGELQGSLLNIGVRIVALVIGLISSGAILSQQRPLTTTVEGLINNFDPTEMSGALNQVSAEMHHVIQKYFTEPSSSPKQQVRAGKIKAVVFIDELDRCPLERIVDILEAIKLFLAEEIFIVLIAVDTRVASEAIHLRYKDVNNPELGREYLEKIVQIPLSVPKTQALNVRNYLKDLMKITEPVQTSSNNTTQTTQSSAISPTLPTNTESTVLRSATSESPGAIQLSVAATLGETTPIGSSISRPGRQVGATVTKIKWQPTALRDTADELEAIAAMGSKYLDGNPRRIKRLLNTYRYVKILSKRNSKPVHQVKWRTEMIAWLVFSLVWPDFMQRAILEAEALPPGTGQQPFLLWCYQRFGKNTVKSDTRELKSEDIETYLKDLKPKDILELRDLASNFLIENPELSELRSVQAKASSANRNGVAFRQDVKKRKEATKRKK